RKQAGCRAAVVASLLLPLPRHDLRVLPGRVAGVDERRALFLGLTVQVADQSLQQLARHATDAQSTPDNLLVVLRAEVDPDPSVGGRAGRPSTGVIVLLEPAVDLRPAVRRPGLIPMRE